MIFVVNVIEGGNGASGFNMNVYSDYNVTEELKLKIINENRKGYEALLQKNIEVSDELLEFHKLRWFL